MPRARRGRSAGPRTAVRCALRRRAGRRVRPRSGCRPTAAVPGGSARGRWVGTWTQSSANTGPILSTISPGLRGASLQHGRGRSHGLRLDPFLVDDVDRGHRNLKGLVTDFVTEPTTMPCGNRSLLFRDPDGNLVNFFTAVTPAAVAKFRR
ncbi:VOC family protein [Streptomyces sp. 900105755]